MLESDGCEDLLRSTTTGTTALYRVILGPGECQRPAYGRQQHRGAEWLRNLYGSEEKWKRIVALKQQWDPENRLSYNKNVTRALEPIAA